MGDSVSNQAPSRRNPFGEKTVQNSRGRHGRNAQYYFSQYCGSTSIHGMQYLGERGRYVIEKIVWLIIIVSVATVSTLLILRTYNKWRTTPVIVTFATTESSISTIPFPAITICPEAKSDMNLFNFTNAYLQKLFRIEMDPLQEQMYEILSQICSADLQLHLNESEDSFFLEDEAVGTLFTISPDLNPINMTEMYWRGSFVNVDDNLGLIFTSEGLCYSFNMLDSIDIIKDPEEFSIPLKFHNVREWSLDKGYLTTDIQDSYPMRTFLSGPDGGLLLESLTTKRSDLDYLCKESLQGYKVVLHHPAEWPNLDRHFRVPLNTAVYVGIKPKMTTVSPTLKGYNPEDRKCYFTDERELAYFLDYTQNNCLQECLSNYTLRKCNCLAFYMPKDKNAPICGKKSIDCLQKSKIDYLRYDRETCNCLPSCTSLEYDVELSYSDWDWHRMSQVMNYIGKRSISKELEKVHMSRLAIYFKDNQFLSAERNELYGAVDFLSNVGGLLGLLIGISITSFIEILYFCTLRLYCNFKKFGSKYWSGEPELIEEEKRNDVNVT